MFPFGLQSRQLGQDQGEALSISDRVMVMREGRIVKELSREQASEELVMQYAVGHEAAAAR